MPFSTWWTFRQYDDKDDGGGDDDEDGDGDEW